MTPQPINQTELMIRVHKLFLKFKTNHLDRFIIKCERILRYIKSFISNDVYDILFSDYLGLRIKLILA